MVARRPFKRHKIVTQLLHRVAKLTKAVSELVASTKERDLQHERKSLGYLTKQPNSPSTSERAVSAQSTPSSSSKHQQRNREKISPCAGCEDFSCVLEWRDFNDVPKEKEAWQWMSSHDLFTPDMCPVHGSAGQPSRPGRNVCYSRVTRDKKVSKVVEKFCRRGHRFYCQNRG